MANLHTIITISVAGFSSRDLTKIDRLIDAITATPGIKIETIRAEPGGNGNGRRDTIITAVIR